MKNFKTLFIISFFIIIFWGVFRLGVSAKEETVLINDGVSDFFITSVGDNPNVTIEDEEVLSVLYETLQNQVPYGTKHSFTTTENSFIAIRILLDGYEDYETELYNLNGLAVRLIAPSGSVYVTQAKSLLLFYVTEAGEYTLQLQGSTIGYYALDILHLRTPFISSTTFIGPQFPFQGYEQLFNNYVLEGGVGIIYHNTAALEYSEVREKHKVLTIDENYSVSKIDEMFDSYLSDGDEVTFLESQHPSSSIITYRGDTLLLKLAGNTSTGGILVLSPSLTILDKNEIASVVQQAGSEITFAQEDTQQLNSIQKASIVLLGVLLLVIIYMTVGKFVLYSLQDEQYLHSVLKKLQERKHVIKKYVLLVNVLIVLPLLLLTLVVVLFQQRFSEWEAFDGSFRTIRNISPFAQNLSVDWVLVPFLIPIVVLIIVNAGLVLWLQWSFVVATRDFVSHLFFGWMSTSFKKIVLKLLWYVVALSALIFLYISAFHPLDFLLVSFTIVVTVFAALFFLASMQGETVFSSFEKKIGILLKVLLILAPIVYFSSIIFSLISPFGVDQTYHFDENIFDTIGSVDSQFSVSYLGNDFSFSFNPYIQKKDVNTKVRQTLASTNTIYLDVSNSADEDRRLLFFDQDLSNFSKVTPLQDIFLATHKKVTTAGNVREILQKEIPQYSFVGLDKTLLASAKKKNNDTSFSLSDFYQIPSVSNETLSVDLDVQGALSFYTVLGDSIDLDVTYERISETIGRDDFVLRVMNREDDVILSEFVSDGNMTLYAESVERTVHVEKENIQEGIYRIEISGIGNTASLDGIEPLSDDIIFHDLSINSKYLVMEFYNQTINRFVRAKTLYFKPMESETLLAQSIPSDHLVKEECGILGLESEPDGTEAEYSIVSIRMDEQEVGSQTVKKLSLPCSLGKVLETYNLYSFTSESYFYPFSYYFTEIDSIDEAVILGSNLKVSEKGDGYYSTEIDMGLWDYEFREPVLFTFTINGNSLKYTGYHIKDFELHLKTEN